VNGLCDRHIPVVSAEDPRLREDKARSSHFGQLPLELAAFAGQPTLEDEK
jgi:hypothetical protein